MSKLCLLCVFVVSLTAQDARSVVAEAQKRSRSQSQRYEGTLQVTDPKSKITEKLAHGGAR